MILEVYLPKLVALRRGLLVRETIDYSSVGWHRHLQERDLKE